jgi:hypothetical protein
MSDWHAGNGMSYREWLMGVTQFDVNDFKFAKEAAEEIVGVSMPPEDEIEATLQFVFTMHAKLKGMLVDAIIAEGEARSELD